MEGSIKRTQRKWSVDETVNMLEYLHDSVLNGYPIEKPNPKAYYKKFLDNGTVVKNVTPELVKNKIRNMKSKYIAALKWKRETGQGVKEKDGEIAFKKVLAKRYPHLTYYKMIWDDRLNVIPPRRDETIQIGPPSSTIGNDHYEQIDELMEMSLSEEFENDGKTVNVCEENREDAEEVVAEFEGNAEESTVEDIAPKKIAATTKAVTPSISRASKKLLEKVRNNKDVNTAKTAFENMMHLREESPILKLNLETDRLDFEKFKFQEQQKQVNIKMNREFELREEEIEVRRLEANNQKEIRLQELEVEKLKWKAILEKKGMVIV